jgi:F-type H+-transporting ATPase subunit b
MIRAASTMLLLLTVATPAFASGGDEGGILYPIVNFVLLIAALIYFARKPVVDYFNDRRGEIQTDISKSAALLREAEEKFATWQRKLADLDSALAEIREVSRRRAETEREHIIADATATAERIRNDATAAIDQELRRSREVLREEAADLAVELAGKLLRDQVSDADRDRLVGEFIERVEASAVPNESGTGR